MPKVQWRDALARCHCPNTNTSAMKIFMQWLGIHALDIMRIQQYWSVGGNPCPRNKNALLCLCKELQTASITKNARLEKIRCGREKHGKHHLAADQL
jgi:hypothetical protein